MSVAPRNKNSDDDSSDDETYRETILYLNKLTSLNILCIDTDFLNGNWS